jgi:Trypsin-like peptidase domain
VLILLIVDKLWDVIKNPFCILRILILIERILFFCLASPLSTFWIYNTMLIENEWGGRGTGFLVSKPDEPGGNVGKVFLVTNKHVLNRQPSLREGATKIILHLNIRINSNTISGRSTSFPTVINNSKSYREHPSADVDVLAFDLTRLLVNNPNIVSQQLPLEKFATMSVIESEDVKIGEEILVIGYPSSLKHKDTNFPLVRQGIISTRIGEKLEAEFDGGDGSVKKRTLRGFFIDGGIIPGSSGSPVIMKPLTTRFKGENMTLQSINLLLGIIADTMYAPISVPQAETLGFAGLGIAFDAETIIETIKMFH